MEEQMLLSKCGVCDSKNSSFFKQHEASGILSSLGINTHLKKILLLGDLFLRV